MKNLFFAVLLSVLSFGVASAQTSTYIIEGRGEIYEQDVADLFGLTDPFMPGRDGRMQITSSFRSILKFDTSQTITDGINTSESPTIGTSVSYSYENVTFELGSRTLEFTSSESFSESLTIFDSTSDAVDTAEIRFTTTIAEFEIFGAIVLGAPNRSSSFIDNADSVNLNRFTGSDITPVIETGFGRNPSFNTFGSVFFGGRDDTSRGGNFFITEAQISLLTPTVPEPATWLMMILGFAVTGIALRRRQRSQTVSS